MSWPHRLVSGLCLLATTAFADLEHVQSSCAVVYQSEPLSASISNTTQGNLVVITVGRDRAFDAGALSTSLGVPLVPFHVSISPQHFLESYFFQTDGGDLSASVDLGAPAVPGGAILYLHEYAGFAQPFFSISDSGTVSPITLPTVEAPPGTLVFVSVVSTASVQDPDPPFLPRNRCGSDLSADAYLADGGALDFSATTNATIWSIHLHLFGRPDAGSVADAGQSDAGFDAGAADAGQPSDAGVGTIDAGLGFDAGTADSGAPFDGGLEQDSGVVADAGRADSGARVDAGPPDAGAPSDGGAPDAGAPIDAGWGKRRRPRGPP